MKNYTLILFFIIVMFPFCSYAQMPDEEHNIYADGVKIRKVLKKELSEPDFYFKDTLRLTDRRIIEINSGIRNFKKSHPENATKAESQYIFALEYYNNAKYEEAWTEADKISKERENRFTCDEYILKSKILAAQGKKYEAIGLLEDALEKYKDNLRLCYNLGLSNYKTGKIDAAMLNTQNFIDMYLVFPDAFLLYAAMLNDEGKWLESFFAYHFFLLLEPNTTRSKIVFQELYSILNQPYDSQTIQFTEYDLDKHQLREYLSTLASDYDKKGSEFKFFELASAYLFHYVIREAKEEYSGLLWDLFVPVYHEIMYSGSAQTYLYYVSSSALPESLNWWIKNPKRVDRFADWFESGGGAGNDEIRKTQN